MRSLPIWMSVSFLVALAAAEPGWASYLLTLNLAPTEYTAAPGGQLTLSGYFSTDDALTFTYNDDRLFGLAANSPHLDILAGSVLLSQDFDPPVGGVFFADEFGGGYLGPSVDGPAVTPVSDLRTFVIPPGTPPGTYRYSYGVDLLPTAGGEGTIQYDSLLTIHVTSEPPGWVLLVVGLGALGVRVRRRTRPAACRAREASCSSRAVSVAPVSRRWSRGARHRPSCLVGLRETSGVECGRPASIR